jgi:hypothetical protein
LDTQISPGSTHELKSCPFCAEDIRTEAVKCKHCGEFLDNQKPLVGSTPPPLPKRNELPWYFQTTWIVFVVLSIPPLALPQIIWHPKLQIKWKILYSFGILFITWGAWLLLLHTISTIKLLIELMKNFQS